MSDYLLYTEYALASLPPAASPPYYGGSTRSEVIFKKSSNLYCQLDLGVC